MTTQISTQYGNEIVTALIGVIVSNREYLSEIDGAIGDGDHGINMSKGFTLCGEAIKGQNLSLAQAFDAVTDALMEGIGGSMGPLYGSLFMGMADSVRDKPALDKQVFLAMLRNGLTELQDISSAGVGDKCLMDTLIPAIEGYEQAVRRGDSFSGALEQLKQAAVAGRDSTRDLVAKIGRASRLGERSRGVLDAGAVSCCLLLCQLADAVEQRLNTVAA
ncbi:TPA: dihydroxyacetone kinase subunit DhaL [Serratia fonticola]|jgi:dihydroxyacetone kinase-like protein|uniref:dihydroxyacetone kinase subunit DhaL n=1 Tax=Serratia fonticola TaxID=47917 RepID=UPI00217B79E4|nr:dihydroxyacetone kinase subunit DhaL [Serratia fonticola]CAI0865289.1 PTS-dependent dihydroxyacetone kinase, ADP-binding subunit dhaL [Serratia fonticola]CAI0924092.1 PTS-dependent dihydroxyacetone kinase, ADP-binding subunit dhaL [Serratia fonticola]CAI1554476.1 PTS-dependent dihydroxyacetone kinase, ADP-binding subunit dhaL [Serratia fonticola]CAI1818092.1 PTS-dependent dihydroxyacetone kinase, ADP-binding subunit dhaL [Serratia fonticola]CAI1823193.1 PTS-dependent dihydroxyacetone kinase